MDGFVTFLMSVPFIAVVLFVFNILHVCIRFFVFCG